MTSKRKHALSAVLLYGLSFPTNRVHANQQQQQQLQQRQRQQECRLYLAETLDDDGHRTLGVFSGSGHVAGELVGSPDLVIPLVDTDITPEQQQQQQQQYNPLEHMVWNAFDAGGWTEALQVQSAALGLASLVRGNMDESNVFLIKSEQDSAGLHRSQDPGVGAFSYYHGAGIIATRDIPVGEELFFAHHSSHWSLDPPPNRSFDDDIDIDGDINKKRSHNGNDWLDDVMQNKKVQKYLSNVKGGMKKNVDSIRSVLLGLLHTTASASLNDSDDTIAAAAAFRSIMPETIMSEMEYLFQPKTKEWLQEHGWCLDHIRQGPSKIPQAGHGAFATRDLVQGSVITSTPLVQIPDKHLLEISLEQANYQHFQLLLNYCFGHPQGTQLLCPIGPNAGLINHSTKPNAVLQWSTRTNVHKKEWFNLTAKQLSQTTEIGLVLDYVALRDIAEGEEITINYGPAWQQAWEDHVKSWQGYTAEYVSAKTMNMKADTKILKTVEEQHFQPYPASVFTSCYYEHRPYEQGIVDRSGRYHDSSSVILKRWEPLEYGVPDHFFLRPCRILERYPIRRNPYLDPAQKQGDASVDLDGFAYTVQVLNFDSMHEDQRVHESETLIVSDVPREAIIFSDFMYTSDMHLPSAFRHEMQLDDSLFPRNWRNI